MLKNKIRFLIISAIVSCSFSLPLFNIHAMKISENNTPNEEKFKDDKKSNESQQNNKENNNDNLKSSKSEQPKEEIDFNKEKKNLSKIMGSNITAIIGIRYCMEDEEKGKLKIFSSMHDKIIEKFLNRASSFDLDIIEDVEEEEIDKIKDYLSSQGLDLKIIEKSIYGIEKTNHLSSINVDVPLHIKSIKEPINNLRKVVNAFKTQYNCNYYNCITFYINTINQNIDEVKKLNKKYESEDVNKLINLFEYINYRLLNNIFDNIAFNLDCLNDILEKTKIYIDYCKKDEEIYHNSRDGLYNYGGRKYSNQLDNTLVSFKNNIVKMLRNIIPPAINEEYKNCLKNQFAKYFNCLANLKKERISLYNEYENLNTKYRNYLDNNKIKEKTLPFKDYLEKVEYKSNAKKHSNKINDLVEIKKLVDNMNDSKKACIKYNGKKIDGEKYSAYKDFKEKKDFFDGIKFLESDIKKITSINNNIKEDMECLINLNNIIYSVFLNKITEVKNIVEEEKNKKERIIKNINNVNLDNNIKNNENDRELLYEEIYMDQESKAEQPQTTNVNNIFDKKIKNNISNNNIIPKNSKKNNIKNKQSNNIINVKEINISPKQENQNKQLKSPSAIQNPNINSINREDKNKKFLDELYKNLNLNDKNTEKIEKMLKDELEILDSKNNLLDKKFLIEEFNDLKPKKNTALKEETYYIYSTNYDPNIRLTYAEKGRGCFSSVTKEEYEKSIKENARKIEKERQAKKDEEEQKNKLKEKQKKYSKDDIDDNCCKSDDEKLIKKIITKREAKKNKKKQNDKLKKEQKKYSKDDIDDNCCNSDDE